MINKTIGMNYQSISFIELESTCTNISMREWEELMDGAIRANKRVINSLVKKHLPDLYHDLTLNLRNPYHYYKAGTHLILVHSSIEYFIKIY